MKGPVTAYVFIYSDTMCLLAFEDECEEIMQK